MGRKSKFFIVNITFILIFIFGLAISFSSKALAQEIPETPGTVDTATPSPIPVDLSSTETQIPGDPAVSPTMKSNCLAQVPSLRKKTYHPRKSTLYPDGLISFGVMQEIRQYPNPYHVTCLRMMQASPLP